MRFIVEWIRHPQQLWLRRALFQVHLWTGIGAGLYLLLASVTGSAVVFRREISRALTPTTYVVVSGTRLGDEALRAAVHRVYPDFTITAVAGPRRPDVAVEITIARGRRVRQRLFDPYSGADLGPSEPQEAPAVTWMVQLHDNLLGGSVGRRLNGVGAGLLTALCLTGLVIWWPGSGSWRRSLSIRRRVGWKRLTWDLHSAIGFWGFALVLMWAVSGLYLAFPDPFQSVVDALEPVTNVTTERRGDAFLAWLARIHFGRAYGTPVKALWVVLGLAPAVLFVTGAIMWWHRVVRRAIGSQVSQAEPARPAVPSRVDTAVAPSQHA